MARNALNFSEKDYLSWLEERTTTNQSVVGGKRCFKGTRLPVEMIGCLASKGIIDEILEDYRGVTYKDCVMSQIFLKKEKRVKFTFIDAIFLVLFLITTTLFLIKIGS